MSLSRRERLLLVRAAVSGAFSGTFRAVITWFLSHLVS